MDTQKMNVKFLDGKIREKAKMLASAEKEKVLTYFEKSPWGGVMDLPLIVEGLDKAFDDLTDYFYDLLLTVTVFGHSEMIQQAIDDQFKLIEGDWCLFFKPDREDDAAYKSDYDFVIAPFDFFSGSFYVDVNGNSWGSCIKLPQALRGLLNESVSPIVEKEHDKISLEKSKK